MKRYAALILVLAMSFAPCFTFPAHAKSQEDKMLAVIQKEKLGKNLEDLSWKELQNTETYRMMAFKLGDDKAAEAMKKAIATNVVPFQEQWNKNLAATYLEFYTPEELESVITQKEKSPYAKQYLMHRHDVGTSMQKKSSDLLSKLNDQVLVDCAPYVKPIPNE